MIIAGRFLFDSQKDISAFTFLLAFICLLTVFAPFQTRQRGTDGVMSWKGSQGV
jgi:hypothetical protein